MSERSMVFKDGYCTLGFYHDEDGRLTIAVEEKSVFPPRVHMEYTLTVDELEELMKWLGENSELFSSAPPDKLNIVPFRPKT